MKYKVCDQRERSPTVARRDGRTSRRLEVDDWRRLLVTGVPVLGIKGFLHPKLDLTTAAEYVANLASVTVLL